MNSGIPALLVHGKTIPEAWEKAVLEVWRNGIDIKTEYDKAGEPHSKDCTMMISIEEPMSEPRIHRAFPGGLEDLEVYRQEVVCGIHDHWINPQEGKWTYTYHKRLFEYEIENQIIDQMNYIISKLSEVPYSRRGQAITWNAKLDPFTDDPPCLQRIWCRIVNTDGDKMFLDMNTHWRSRDAYKASFMNIFALTDLQRTLAEELSNKMQKEIRVGRYVDITDSFHIYGSYYEDFNKFLKLIESRTFEQRTWHSKFAEPFFKKARVRLEEESKR
jgi:thymidylate synthase